MHLAKRNSLLSLLALLMVPAAWLSMPARTASACSINPDYDPVALSYAVVVGRIDGFDPAISRDAGGPAPMHVTVERTLRGPQQPAEIEVLARVTQPGVPLLCLEIDPAEYTGKRAVISLYTYVDGALGTGGRLDIWVVDSPRAGVGVAQLAALYDGDYQPVAPGPPNVGTGLADASRGDGAGLVVVAGILLAIAAVARGTQTRPEIRDR